MDLRDTPDEAQFRSELNAWLEANVPPELRGHRGGAARYSDDAIRNWSRALYEAGYIGLTWPKDYGGGGKPYSYQAIFLEEMARAEAPSHLGVIGLGMAGPTIIALGTEAQKARYLQPLLAADEIWCQGFSEPGAGSDLSAVRTSARLEGSHFVVDGLGGLRGLGFGHRLLLLSGVRACIRVDPSSCDAGECAVKSSCVVLRGLTL